MLRESKHIWVWKHAQTPEHISITHWRLGTRESRWLLACPEATLVSATLWSWSAQIAVRRFLVYSSFVTTVVHFYMGRLKIVRASGQPDLLNGKRRRRSRTFARDCHPNVRKKPRRKQLLPPRMYCWTLGWWKFLRVRWSPWKAK